MFSGDISHTYTPGFSIYSRPF